MDPYGSRDSSDPCLTRVSPLQVSVGSSSLSSTDVFLLLAPSGCWMWKGTNSTPKEVQGARDLARILQVVPTPVDEGEEEGVMEDRCQELLILQCINQCLF